MMLQPEWLHWPEVRALHNAFMEGGAGLRFVGGCVRDTIMGRAVSEIDAATNATPEQMIALLESDGLRAIPTGIAHGTVTALVHGTAFEITTLRKDLTTDGRHAEVAFTDSWEEDARRRDFTMNALYLGIDGILYDYVGGLEDCKARYVRFIGDASARIQEDYLRILRYFRFVATVGGNRFDEAALAACHAHQGGIATLSGERIWQELLKLLAAEDACTALECMQQFGILRAIFPDLGLELSPQKRLPANAPALLRLAALIRQPESLSASATRLKLSGKQRRQLECWLAHAPYFSGEMTLWEARKQRRKLGREDYLSALQLAQACSDEDAAAWASLHDVADWQPPLFPITAADLMQRGMVPGKALGDRLKTLEMLWEESGYSLVKEELLLR